MSTVLEIQTKINETWEYCIQRFGRERCVALCLHGSQNYELDMPESDVDAKLIIAPTWDEVVFVRKPLSETIQGPYGDINVTDVRLYIGVNLKKQNFNFLETLFTPYSCVNNDYADLWNRLIEHREEIAHFNPDLAKHTMLGQAENQRKRWGRFDDKKTLYHLMRISDAIEKYQRGWYFADTLIPLNHNHIMQVRKGEISQESMEYMFNLFYEHIHYIIENTKYVGPTYETAGRLMDEIQREFVYRALYELRIEE